MSREVVCSAHEIVSAQKPFSNFAYVDSNFGGALSIRRIFTQARARNFLSFVREEVPSKGIVADEDAEISHLFPSFVGSRTVRLTFWKVALQHGPDVIGADLSDVVGYALLKQDSFSDRPPKWHVFESVIEGYPDSHNYRPSNQKLSIRVLGRRVEISGIPYHQQNGFNKACAQVALKTLCGAFLGNPNVTYREINRAAATALALPTPGDGLRPQQIEAVLRHFRIPFYALYYPGSPKKSKIRTRLGYQKLLYSGVEAGTGSLLAFSMGGRKAQRDVGHIIPIYGHTFNEDTWAPVAEGAYFKIGNKIRYVPSEAWTNSFLCHDDNFGCNFCLPKDFVSRKRADYVVALRPRGFEYPGFVAEISASELFYSILPQVPRADNKWLRCLLDYVDRRQLILRTVPNRSPDYAAHLSGLDDWEGNVEDRRAVDILKKKLPRCLWMVEVSIPDLFSTNLRKLGEILLDGGQAAPASDLSHFVFCRLPGLYVFLDRVDGRGHPRFQFFKSGISGHTTVQMNRAKPRG